MTREQFYELDKMADRIEEQDEGADNETKWAAQLTSMLAYEAYQSFTDVQMESKGRTSFNAIYALLEYVKMKTAGIPATEEMFEETEFALFMIDAWNAGPALFF
jgi:hypothetical protein